jgi:hypothetical protein
VKPAHRFSAKDAPDLLSYAKESAGIVFAKTGQHLPTAIARTGGAVEVYVTAFCAKDRHEAASVKDNWARFLVSLAAKCDELITIVEGWTLYVDPNTPRDQVPMEGLEHVPGRKETILLTHSSPQGESVYMSEIHRYAGSPPVLGEWKSEPIAGSEGRFAGIFNRARKHERN